MTSTDLALIPSSATNFLKEFILSYGNDNVLRRYMEEHNASRNEAENAFLAMKQFLFTAAFVDGEHTPSQQIDDIWHTFIIFTRDYREFCNASFGGFLDHEPASGGASLSSYKWTKQNAERLFGALDDYMWPDLLADALGRCHLKCNGKCTAPCNIP